ncbi:glycoside hydrolase family 18 protein [Paenibacillus sp. CC-CFT742]|uniref:glycoside hydrolase family 18 protein n=1 Tax=Paenibacillus illinoisensis TaxID=59845 RepID=UPI002041913A|nr:MULTISPECIES: glycoside hydrolase family 18 protein [Paenibacillus]MCM3205840.1 glycoside hydrolase family 18 protein [Paenibacillus illinoisensis]WJH28523.1 glycoside hydrolase family 18 protein [Paenibacillus sp. CC-CFT742]
MNPKWIIGYVGHRDLHSVPEAELSRMTHINIAFAHIQEGIIQTSHLQHMDRIPIIRKAFPDLKMILSVGGWSAGGFSEAAATEQRRQKLAESAVLAVTTYGLDGIDLDWEYPCYGEAGIAASAEDRVNFTLLLKTMRAALTKQGEQDDRYYMLTIAAGADQYYIDGTEMDQVQQYLDYVQLMTYDMRGGFQVLTGHHTNLYTATGDLYRISTDASVRMFLNAGVPRNKIVIGAAFYSRMWKGVPDRNNGLHQMAETTGGYGPEYTELSEKYIDLNGYIRYWDDEAKAPYLFNGSTLISYDDPESVTAKCRYVLEQDLAGLMFWEYKCDTSHELLRTMDVELGAGRHVL